MDVRRLLERVVVNILVEFEFSWHNKQLHSTAYPLRKLPYRCAPFYGNFHSAYTESELGVM